MTQLALGAEGAETQSDKVVRHGSMDPAQTIGNLIDKPSIAFIASVDGEGFPNLKAMLAPRERVGLRKFWFTTNTSSM
ncbi:MAG: pyridoxamine 5'-phosphate oxidase family protein [Bifidobacteriaceae bacterium]|nr:pyridoxamine 5'-phosphate oxidase family protein [Bifidobacteriaceae bacterium]